MSSNSEEAVGKLEALLSSNSETVESEEVIDSRVSRSFAVPKVLSEEERKLEALLSGNTLGAVSEDFVELGIPGFEGSSLAGSGSTRGVAVSPMMSVMSSGSSGVSRGGAFSTEANTGKKFSIVRITKEDKLCLADIGDGAKFCLKANCPISSHKNTNLFKVDDEGVIVIAKSRDAAFAMPVLGGGVLPESILEEWVSLPRTLLDWGLMFKAANQEENFTSEAEFQSRLIEQQRSDVFKTPSKRQGKSSAFFISTSQDLVTYSQGIPFGKKEAFRKANPGRVTDLVLGLDDGLVYLSDKFCNYVKETQDILSSLELSDSMLEMKKDSIDGLLGSISLMGGSSFQNPTVFGTLAALGARIEEMDRAGPPLVDFSPVMTEIEKFKTESKRIQNLSITLITRLSDKVKMLETTAPPAAAFPSREPTREKVDLSDIMLRLEFLELERSRQDLEIQKLIAEGDDTAIKFGGLGLKSLEETGSWISTNSTNGVLPFSLIPDVYFILDIVAADGVTSQSSMLQTLNRLKTLDLESEYEAKAIAAFLLEVPRFFHGSSESGSFASGSGESQLSMLPTYKSWSLGQGSRKKLLERKLPGIRISFRALITNALHGNNPVMYALAIEALDRSISFIVNFGSWIDRAFEYAHVGSKLSEAKAWALVTQLGRRIFSEIHVVRMGTTQAMNSDRRSMCNAILWSVFRTHDKMTEFEDANFEDHPAVSSEYIKFLATNSGFDMIVDLEKDVTALKSDSKEVERKLNGCQKKADSASTTADMNKKAITELGKRVDKKADR